MVNRRPRCSKPEASPAQPHFLDHTFASPELLLRALTHRSLAAEASSRDLLHSPQDPTADNEQLEFLGDSILGMIVAEALFRLFPASREGELTRLRASLVSRVSLAEAATRIDLGPLLRLGRGEAQTGGHSKPAILADAFEALIAALYLDGGLEPARHFIDRHLIQPALPALNAALIPGTLFSGAVGDHKSALQERLQATGQGQPLYILTGQSGPDHLKRFHIQVRIAAPLPEDPNQTLILAEAEGSTKKQAQQAAAQLALAYLAAQAPPA